MVGRSLRLWPRVAVLPALGSEGKGLGLWVRLVEDDEVGREDGDEEGGVVRQGGGDEEDVVVGHEYDEGVVVGPGMGKEDAVEWGEFHGFERPSGVVEVVSKLHSACWSGAWGRSSENPSPSLHKTCVGNRRVERGNLCW